MQKALIIKSSSQSNDCLGPLNAGELNEHLSDGWIFVSATPFGCSMAPGDGEQGSAIAAMLVIVGKNSHPRSSY
jgi:hypothetical protein